MWLHDELSIGAEDTSCGVCNVLWLPLHQCRVSATSQYWYSVTNCQHRISGIDSSPDLRPARSRRRAVPDHRTERVLVSPATSNPTLALCAHKVVRRSHAELVQNRAECVTLRVVNPPRATAAWTVVTARLDHARPPCTDSLSEQRTETAPPVDNELVLALSERRLSNVQ